MKRSPFKIWRKKQGLTVEAFVVESRKRGKTLRVGTVYRWDAGKCKPRPTTQTDLKHRFDGIRF